ncbi:uncharacterized protein [Physcomitrium patens]|uniref:Uncharacterized protein n=1 Tax=Physcomitrium patens TaxID=3218 RepID=A0A2K1K644_PHYPA|nr:uncharacterized protein LOC112285708 [Physcomitrium patens]XP_024382494.1 uncharacterized protein LOC112285708 [Physcomitrium patens]PNR49249.1 hypothetical protein PHYPA_011145 [Physcomitrium patens]|eukprot:XP_024382493.1 uncharacterized protein LOC112285708 [Physcomitrella patens]
MATAVAAGSQASVVAVQWRGKVGKSGWGGACGSGPMSTYISRSVWRTNGPRKQLNGIRVRRVTRCEASGRGFDSQVSRMAEEARRSAGKAARAFGEKADQVFEDVKRKAVDFQEKNDVQGKARRAVKTVNLKFEEFAYDFNKQLGKWDRQYRVTEKAQQVKEYATEQAQNVDRQFGIRQKARNATTDFRLKFPTYRRQFTTFLETPFGKTVVSLFLVWFIVSGWAFRIFFFSLWFLPFAGPFLLGTISKAAVVEGACPNCGARYVGGRSQVVTCQRCRGVVWQPRQDFSREGFSKEDKSDPTIIDVDIDTD